MGSIDPLVDKLASTLDPFADMLLAIPRAISRALGIYTHDEIFTDIQITNLLAEGEADDAARRTAKYNAYGNAGQYFDMYRGFQRDYRRKYSKTFLKSVGFNPSSTATTRVVIPSKVETYVESTYGFVDVGIEYAGDTYLFESQKCDYARGELLGYDPDTGKLVESGKTYTYEGCSENTPTSLELYWRREYEETIIDNLIINYSYDSSSNTLVIAGELYSVGTLSFVINSFDQYETVCTHIPKEYVDSNISAYSTGPLVASITYLDDTDNDGTVYVEELTNDELNLGITLDFGAIVGDVLYIDIDGAVTEVTITQGMVDNGYVHTTTTFSTAFEAQLANEVIYTDVERLTKTYSNSLFDNEVTFIEYRVTSGEVGTGSRYVMEPAKTLDIYDTVVVDISAIVPMKEDNVIVDLGNRNLERMLSKLNLNPDQLKSSLENPDMDSAYVMMGVNLDKDDPAVNKVVFQMFDLMVTGNGNVTISISKLSMEYSFAIDKHVNSGTIGPIGTYTKTIGTTSSTSDPATITLRYQGSETEYREIVITDFTQRYTISGKDINTFADSGPKYTRLVIPLEILNSLRYREWVPVYESSLCMLGYAMEVVEVKWYETAAFSSILQIVGIVLMFWTSGASSALVALGRIAIAAVIVWVAVQVANMIGGTLGKIVGAAIAIAAFYYLGYYDGASKSSTWLQAANTGINVINQSLQHDLATIQANGESTLESIQEKIDEIKEKEEELDDDDAYIYAKSVHNVLETSGSPNPMFMTTEQYVNSIINTDWLVSSGWMYNIDREIKIRKTVYTG